MTGAECTTLTSLLSPLYRSRFSVRSASILLTEGTNEAVTLLLLTCGVSIANFRSKSSHWARLANLMHSCLQATDYSSNATYLGC